MGEIASTFLATKSLRESTGERRVAAVPHPRSASTVWTGIAGLVAAAIAIIILKDWLAQGWAKTLGVLFAGAGAMVLVDLLLYRTGANPTTGLSQEAPRDINPKRMLQKLAGLWLSMGALAAIYALTAEYSGGYFDAFKSAALWCLPGIVVASPFYIAYVDRRQREPNDAYAQLGQLMWGQRPESWEELKLHARSWLVKGFFLPLMFQFTHNGLVELWARDSLPVSFEGAYGAAIDLLYLGDVMLAAIAYALTLRVIDAHNRSVEPTLGGWVICLVCYPPFVNSTLDAYLNYNGDEVYWGAVFAPWPVVYVAWGTAIIILVAVYMMATVAFGLRFSNLTNRGIITSGPYRWMKHPAYVSKNLSWWLISVPFIGAAGWQIAVQSCLMLLVINLVYFLRAKTEERHLRADPVYRDYESFIAAHGLWAIIKRAKFGARRARG